MPDPLRTTLYVDHDGMKIAVDVSQRECSRLAITVHPDLSVTAVAPSDRSLDEVAAHLKRRRRWIITQRQRFKMHHPLAVARRYVAGETHLYLGRQYRLRIHSANDATVKLVGRFFNVYVPDPCDPNAAADAMTSWYRSKAIHLFADRLDRFLTTASLKPYAPAKLRIQPMTRRWGSCSKSGTITLNSALIRAPIHCIEYVIMHEACHLRFHDHSPQFFRLLGRLMPDWRKRKDRLDTAAWH